MVTLTPWKLFNKTHSVSFSTNIATVLFYRLTSEKSIHYMLANLPSFSWVLLIIEKWFKETHCVRYSTKVDMVMYYYLTSEKPDTQC